MHKRYDRYPAWTNALAEHKRYNNRGKSWTKEYMRLYKRATQEQAEEEWYNRPPDSYHKPKEY